ncbi:uncharacterized protein LOC118439463 [Folsomia candida]|uniref:uncharacterized protein LOC118439463 n=1 Tax=Folsomia candida TaxID=158441 RepID=UPI0016052023|nr:uncharacterized protein LOC118439463 [Folsomia candida]
MTRRLKIRPIPTNQVNADIGDICEYYIHDYNNDWYDLQMYVIGSDEYVGSVEKVSPMTDFPESSTFKEYGFKNRKKNFTGLDRTVKRDGQPTLIVWHYMLNDRV